MPWWNRSRAATPPAVPTPPPVGVVTTPPALTASAKIEDSGRRRLYIQPEQWQDEVWGYYDDLGEFGYAVDWLANALSRVRLRAGKLEPGQDEPKLVDTGLASDLVAELGSDVAGRSAIMSRLAVLLSVPGEGWVLGETVGVRERRWDVYSTDEIRSRGATLPGRRQRSGPALEVIDIDRSRPGSIDWRPVAEDYFLARVWRPHPRFAHQAYSPARGARKVMRELELANRKIQATYLSRLASAGIVIFPDEITFPVRPEFADAADPFMAEWVETAKEAIQTPGTAAAVVPMPMRVPGDYVDKVKFIDFTTALDEKIIEKRESAIRRLATKLDLPAEVMLGMGEVNHWTSWQLEESAIKIHIAPPTENIVNGLTVGYLHPRMKAQGEDPTGWVVWYDASELTQRPDRSAHAVEVFDRFELSGAALRRETGFDEDDAPTEDELAEIMLRKAAADPKQALAVRAELTGKPPVVSGPVGTGGGPPTADGEPDTTGPPGTREDEPPEPGASEQAASLGVPRMTSAFVESHLLQIRQVGGGWELVHPAECDHRQFGCPVTWHAYSHPGFAPGTSGRYRLHLGRDGGLVLGARVFDLPDGNVIGLVKR